MTTRSAWWRGAVIYQIYTRSFLDTDGDGVGDLAGVIDRLDYLSDLGVDVVWLSPLHPTPNIDLGYDSSDYYEVAPEMGDLDTFDRLISEAGRRGIRIMMDLVMDYTSTAHPWFVQARSSRTSPYHDWYIWGDAPPDQPPSNWPAFFSSGSAWTFDPPTRRWYLHYFTSEQPELNWANPRVRSAFHDIMHFWLDRGVAGFRLDVISFLSKPESLGDMPPEFLPKAGDYYANGPQLHTYLQELRREVFDRYPDVVALGEGFGLTLDQAIDFVAPDRRELDLLFLFEISALTFADTGDRQIPSMADIRAALKRWQDALVPAGAWPTLFLGNHDVARMLNRFGDTRPEHREASAKLLNTLLLTHRGTPVLYQGDEIGMTNPHFEDLSEFRDVAVLNAWRLAVAAGNDTDPLKERLSRTGRDTGRTPVQWSAAANAGFTSASEPWIKVNQDFAEVNVAAQNSEPNSVLNYVRNLIQLRRTCSALRDGDVRFVDLEHPTIFAFERQLEDERVLTVMNWDDGSCKYEVQDGATAWRPLIASFGDYRMDGEAICLRPFEALVLEWRGER